MDMASTPESFSETVRERAARIRLHGASAVAGLYDLTAERLVRFAATITRNQHDAEDAVATALLRVVADPSPLMAAHQPWPYLIGMVRNDALVLLRKNKRWSIARGLIDLVTRTKVDELEREESAREVWLALRNLPTDQSEVVVLKIWEGLTFQQISEVQGVPAATSASRYRAALTKLESVLANRGYEVPHE